MRTSIPPTLPVSEEAPAEIVPPSPAAPSSGERVRAWRPLFIPGTMSTEARVGPTRVSEIPPPPSVRPPKAPLSCQKARAIPLLTLVVLAAAVAAGLFMGLR